MTVESYNVIAIASLSDWPKNIAPVFQTMIFFPRFDQVTSSC